MTRRKLPTYVQEIFYPGIYSRGASFPGNFLLGEFFPVKVSLGSFFPGAKVTFSRSFHVAVAKLNINSSWVINSLAREFFPANRVVERVCSNDTKIQMTTFIDRIFTHVN